MKMKIPAALSLSSEPSALIESVSFRVMPGDLDCVHCAFVEASLYEVSLHLKNRVYLNFGCFDDALRFAEAAGFAIATLLEHREHFWYASVCDKNKAFWYLLTGQV